MKTYGKFYIKEFEPLIIIYFGKCVSTGESALSFYFNKENSSLIKSVLLIYFTVTI
jgi:hypothetical protein